jgi:hypothetical protein
MKLPKLLSSIALCLLVASCDLNYHMPPADGCPRVEVKMVDAGVTGAAGAGGEGGDDGSGDDGCVLLVSANADDEHPDVLFRRPESDSCGGPAVMCLHPGESAWVLERVRPAPHPEWSAASVACDAAECVAAD